MKFTRLAGAAFGLIVADAARAHGYIPTAVPVAAVRAVGTVESGGDDYATGRVLLAANNLPEALAHFRQALVTMPQSVDALNAVGVIYDRLGRSDIARTYYEAGLAIAPDSAMLLNNLGYSLFLDNDFAGAIAPLRAAAEGGDPEIAATARHTLALVAAALTEARVAPADAPASAYVERTTEGEQRLVLLDRPADAEPAIRSASADVPPTRANDTAVTRVAWHRQATPRPAIAAAGGESVARRDPAPGPRAASTAGSFAASAIVSRTADEAVGEHRQHANDRVASADGVVSSGNSTTLDRFAASMLFFRRSAVAAPARMDTMAQHG